MKPLIVVNFKAYNEGLGSKGLEIISLLSNYDNVIMSLPSPLISMAAGYSINKNSCVRKSMVFAQHVDPVESGAHTGSVTVEEIKMSGASGSLVNHSEKRIPLDDIKKTVNKLKEKNLISIVCCQDSKEALKIKELKPDFIAYEPPELIGGDVSVSTSKPEVVKEIVKLVKPVKLLVGAGVKTRKDIEKCMDLGAEGVLIASGIIKAETEQEIKKLIEW